MSYGNILNYLDKNLWILTLERYDLGKGFLAKTFDITMHLRHLELNPDNGYTHQIKFCVCTIITIPFKLILISERSLIYPINR